MAKITHLEIENVLRLKSINLNTNGSPVVIVGGNNEQGKSSLLNAIKMTLGGGKTIPQEPVRVGAKKGKSSITIDETIEFGALLVTRTYKKGKSSVTITDKTGTELKSPQAILDKLWSQLGHDPLEFVRTDAQTQTATIKAMVPELDTSALDTERDRLYAERTALGREVKSAQARMDASKYHPDVPDMETSVKDLVDEMSRRKAVNDAHKKKRHDLESLRATAVDIKGKIDALKADLANVTAEGKKLADVVEKLQDEDINEIATKIDNVGNTNRQARENADHKRFTDEWEKLAEKHEQMNTRIAEIDQEKERLLSEAKLPVDGLAFSDDGLLLDGLPFEQASQEQQIRASAAIGLAQNPELKVMLIRDGSLLDEKHLAMLGEWADENGAQLFIERVGHGEECSVIIEDGEVRHD
jgi:DNA repair exonuclease SbcCD ATPase subunit